MFNALRYAIALECDYQRSGYASWTNGRTEYLVTIRLPRTRGFSTAKAQGVLADTMAYLHTQRRALKGWRVQPLNNVRNSIPCAKAMS